MVEIGIIGQGFVGSAVREGLKNYFQIKVHDKDKSKYSDFDSIKDIVINTDMTFVCVPTPMMKNGQCDVSLVHGVLKEISNIVQDHNKIDYIAIIKSTIPPGTTDIFQTEFGNIKIVFNPEFLTESNSIDDFKNQNRIILGGCHSGTTKVKQIFSKAFPNIPIIKTSSSIAEMVKYLTNTYLGVKVSFANEMYQICKGLNIDYDKVIEYARYDNRLGGSHWSVPGPDGDFGYGGHCIPKDIKALEFIAKELGVTATMLSAAIDKNNEVRTDRDWERQKGRAVSIDH